jgi:hypothetical protein
MFIRVYQNYAAPRLFVDWNSSAVAANHPKSMKAGHASAGMYKPNSVKPWSAQPKTPRKTVNESKSDLSVDLR